VILALGVRIAPKNLLEVFWGAAWNCTDVDAKVRKKFINRHGPLSSLGWIRRAALSGIWTAVERHYVTARTRDTISDCLGGMTLGKALDGVLLLHKLHERYELRELNCFY
jgi:hypothetical protein